MKRLLDPHKIKLAGFNNLTKSLSFNLYDFCAARNQEERESYVNYIAKRYSAEKITEILKGICDIIEAKIISVSDQDYEPWGASSMVLMSDLKGSGVNMHLDKSHICAHTYPDFADGGSVCSFRIDIDISTCGEISPLKTLNYMFEQFDSDVVVVDYVVRGFTRDEEGRRVFMDHKIQSIQDFIDKKILKDYHCIDLALQSENIWQTKMLRVKQQVSTYFASPINENDQEVKDHMKLINREMRGVVHNWPE